MANSPGGFSEQGMSEARIPDAQGNLRGPGEQPAQYAAGAAGFDAFAQQSATPASEVGSAEHVSSEHCAVGNSGSEHSGSEYSAAQPTGEPVETSAGNAAGSVDYEEGYGEESAVYEAQAEDSRSMRAMSRIIPGWNIIGEVGENGTTRTLTRIDPKSAFKLAAMFSVALFLVWLVAMLIVWFLLVITGIWGKANGMLGDISGGSVIGTGMYFGVVVGWGLLEIVVVTLLAPVMAAVYNACASLVGGLRVTFDR
ncbi:DUF3566 domain-containing protein [Corynebacterium heidelbergense]|uniref:DUF3566 domain-containing protein n=1 Tax=Corynebacterium heidelbergense TaxID=2055947 RepID=A0A364VD82_9CORY|nr:DUF3566 domain-containing protein [Corynebacterium heidelbergense]RAV34526.1 hypothetical protein CWC39_02735 [Corynebacterium heidelbergense]WCZ35597.1 hypothetical protein CHEID_00060 [Corynebacterium heidelbergense]